MHGYEFVCIKGRDINSDLEPTPNHWASVCPCIGQTSHLLLKFTEVPQEEVKSGGWQSPKQQVVYGKTHVWLGCKPDFPHMSQVIAKTRWAAFSHISTLYGKPVSVDYPP